MKIMSPVNDRSGHPFRLALLLAALFINFSLPVNATTVLPLSLEQLSQQAETIFHGRVLANRVEQDAISGQIVTYTDFEVIDTIKGNSQSTLTIKQLGGRLPGKQYYMRVHGVPKFVTNKEYVVFLPAVSVLGFCSPLGLYQGSFSIKEVNGTKIVIHGRNSSVPQVPAASLAKKFNTPDRSVTIPLATDVNHPGQSSLPDFLSTVRAMLSVDKK